MDGLGTKCKQNDDFLTGAHDADADADVTFIVVNILFEGEYVRLAYRTYTPRPLRYFRIKQKREEN